VLIMYLKLMKVKGEEFIGCVNNVPGAHVGGWRGVAWLGVGGGGAL
jgi:hypothetical protein